jgi:hypothetical protein
MTDLTTGGGDILKHSERLSAMRGIFLLVLAVSVLGMGLTFVGKHMLQNWVMPEQMLDLRRLFQVMWLASLTGVIAVNARIGKSAVLKGLINDERAKLQRLKAFALGFWVLLIAVVLALLTGIFIDLELKSTLLMVLCIGGSIPPLAQAFTSMDR